MSYLKDDLIVVWIKIVSPNLVHCMIVNSKFSLQLIYINVIINFWLPFFSLLMEKYWPNIGVKVNLWIDLQEVGKQERS